MADGNQLITRRMLIFIWEMISQQLLTIKNVRMLFKMLLIPTMFNIQNLNLFWELRGKGKGTCF